jgi:uncharacterized membrane-anchored protein
MTAFPSKAGILVAVCLLQLLVPASMIGRREATLHSGTAYRFKTRPVDPYDAFRGKYVALRFEEEIATTDGSQIENGQRLFVEVSEGADGFAKLGMASRKRPEGASYIKVRANYSSGGNTINVELPFDRYYMNEKRAPEAERAYWDSNRGTNRNTYAVVKVLNGMAVTEGLYIDGVHVKEYLEKEGSK